MAPELLRGAVAALTQMVNGVACSAGLGSSKPAVWETLACVFCYDCSLLSSCHAVSSPLLPPWPWGRRLTPTPIPSRTRAHTYSHTQFTCALSLLLQDTVETVMAILGMQACEGTEAVPPHARSHTVLLAGQFPTEERALVRWVLLRERAGMEDRLGRVCGCGYARRVRMLI